MSTEIAGGGQVTPAALRIMESGIRRVLAKVEALSGEPPLAGPRLGSCRCAARIITSMPPTPGFSSPSWLDELLPWNWKGRSARLVALALPTRRRPSQEDRRYSGQPIYLRATHPAIPS